MSIPSTFLFAKPVISWSHVKSPDLIFSEAGFLAKLGAPSSM